MSHTQLGDRIQNHDASLTVIGQGYVGLPLAVGLAPPGFRVTGLDSDPDRVAENFFLACSPERIDPGNRISKLHNITMMVGGVTPACARMTALLYRQIIGRVIEVSTPKVAELAKLYENVFRNVNIALANEFALMCRRLGVSAREVIDAAATKPFGFLPFYPGPGIGGHFIPPDPNYLPREMRPHRLQGRFLHPAAQSNRSMPGYVVELVTQA